MAMNLDFRLQVGWRRHPKLRMLRARLGAEGILGWVGMIEYAAEHRPDGRLGVSSPEELAAVAEYQPEDWTRFGQALLDLRLVDRDAATGEYLVHGWLEWNPHCANAAARARKAREAAAARWGKTDQVPEQQVASVLDVIRSLTPEQQAALTAMLLPKGPPARSANLTHEPPETDNAQSNAPSIENAPSNAQGNARSNAKGPKTDAQPHAPPLPRVPPARPDPPKEGSSRDGGHPVVPAQVPGTPAPPTDPFGQGLRTPLEALLAAEAGTPKAEVRAAWNAAHLRLTKKPQYQQDEHFLRLWPIVAEQGAPEVISRIGNFAAWCSGPRGFGAETFSLASFTTHYGRWAEPPKPGSAKTPIPTLQESMERAKHVIEKYQLGDRAGDPKKGLPDGQP